MNSNPEILAWIDTETTGLDPRHDRLLQVACILTDTQLREVSDEPLVLYVHHSPVQAASLRDLATPVVRDMHDRTGLWDTISSGQALPLEAAERTLLDYIAASAPARRQARIAGSSIRHDLNFLDAWMPTVANHLHYRSVDVSAVTYVARHNLGYEPGIVDSSHEALADIRDSIAALRDVLAHLGALERT